MKKIILLNIAITLGIIALVLFGWFQITLYKGMIQAQGMGNSLVQFVNKEFPSQVLDFAKGNQPESSPATPVIKK